ncbi:thioredoxin-disulfide reductase [Candidatus Woesearchaeota archaeon]|nr:thioredoxin-disulfide reductase [Candidatus Woesearchaeota archaeon]
MESLIILGTGIAGLTAAIYAARANLTPLVLSGPEDGGQLTLTTDVENFPGFPEGVKGPELINLCKQQAERFGTRFQLGLCTKIEKKESQHNQKNHYFVIEIDGEKKIETKTVIIATGASARWLGLPSEQKYKGRGVTTCATCDGAFFKGKEVAVIGGGDSAMEESLFLTKFASKVTIIHRKEEFRASKIMQERVFKNEKIKVVWNSEVAEILGDGKKVTAIKLKNTATNQLTDFRCDGVFLAIGHFPNTSFLKDFIDLDEKEYLKADKMMHTNINGIFAAGDVQDIRFRQAITASGSGCMAAMEAEKYLAHQEE